MLGLSYITLESHKYHMHITWESHAHHIGFTLDSVKDQMEEMARMSKEKIIQWR